MDEGLKISLYRTGYSDSLGLQLFSVLKLLEALDALGSKSVSFVILDWSQVKIIHPAFVLPVATVLKKYSDEFSLKIRHENIEDDLRSYLDTIGFFNSLLSEDALIISNNLSKNYLPFHRFSCDEKVSKYSELATSNIREWLNHQGLNSAIKTGISYVISELVDNILEHSNSKFGWIAAQRFPTKGFVDICLADSGIGLLESYRNSGFIVHDNMDAINQALNGVSTKNIKERGYGMRTSISTVSEGTSGSFMIVTGDAIFNNGEIAAFKGNWDGVLCAIRLNVNVDDFNLYRFVEG